MQASPMDKITATPYSFTMLRVLMIIVTAVSLAAASFAVQAHEKSMSGMTEHGALTQHMEQVSASMADCGEGKSCKADSGLCAFVCAGLSAWLPLERASIKQSSSQQKYLLPPDTVLQATAPGRNDRPPISHLL